MPANLESLRSDALDLPPTERLQLAEAMLASLEPAASELNEAAWDQEVRRRIAEFDAGNVSPIAGTKVFEELDRRLSR